MDTAFDFWEQFEIALNIPESIEENDLSIGYLYIVKFLSESIDFNF